MCCNWEGPSNHGNSIASNQRLSVVQIEDRHVMERESYNTRSICGIIYAPKQSVDKNQSDGKQTMCSEPHTHRLHTHSE